VYFDGVWSTEAENKKDDGRERRVIPPRLGKRRPSPGVIDSIVTP
jgi:hypothetical protein